MRRGFESSLEQGSETKSKRVKLNLFKPLLFSSCSRRWEGSATNLPKKLGTREEIISYLPNELIIEILEWLPIKSIVKFRCVSKSWSALFKTPAFIKNHRVKQGSKGTMLLLRRCYPPPQAHRDVLSFHDLDSPEREVRPPIPASIFKDLVGEGSMGLKFAGSANGIVAILYDVNYILSNPALHEFKLLPPCLFEPPQDYETCFAADGFGVSCNNGEEFKIIAMYNFRHLYREDYWLPSVVVVYLYNSRSNSWRKVDDAPLFPFPCYSGDEVFLNGACHWAGHTFSGDHKMILSFDMTSEVFKQLELPDCLHGFNVYFPHPIVLNKCLGVVQYKEQFSELDPVEIWVMKEYGVKESWTKQYVISAQPVASVFLPWKDDTMLMVQEPRFYKQNLAGAGQRRRIKDLDARFNSQVTSIILRTDEMKHFSVFGAESTMRALIYEESLVSLN